VLRILARLDLWLPRQDIRARFRGLRYPKRLALACALALTIHHTIPRLQRVAALETDKAVRKHRVNDLQWAKYDLAWLRTYARSGFPRIP
jgi:hypothetical protein